MKIAIGSDHGGFNLKKEVLQFLSSVPEIDVMDCGTYDEESVDYPDIAAKVCDAIIEGEAERGILICGTGIGISIAANKKNGIRCALCSDVYSARMSREHNDANVLALGGRVLGAGLAIEIVGAWLKGNFLGGRHAGRIAKITALEQAPGA